jgi:hypothetical protein
VWITLGALAVTYVGWLAGWLVGWLVGWWNGGDGGETCELITIFLLVMK